MTKVLDFYAKKAGNKKAKEKDVIDTNVEKQYIYYVQAARQTGDIFLGHNSVFLVLSSSNYGALDVQTFVRLRNKALLVIQEVSPETTSIIVENIIPLGELTSENNLNNIEFIGK